MTQPESQAAAAPPKRRWHQYSLRTLLLLPVVLALVLSAVYSWPYVHRRYIVWRLQDYVDKDLRKLNVDDRRKVARWSEELVGGDLKPLMFHNADIPGVGRRLLILRPPEYLYLYEAYRLNLLDSPGRATRIATLSVPENPLFVSSGESRHGFLCLTVQTEKRENRYFYRIADGSVETIRQEENDGTLVRYSPVGPGATPAVLQELLVSSDRVHQLRGLAALLYGNQALKDVLDEKMRRRLSELVNSPDPWISEEATVALEEAKL